MQSKARYRDF